MEITELIPIKLGRIQALPSGYLVFYIPVDAMKILNLRKGQRIAIYVDPANKCLVVKPVELGGGNE